MQNHANEIVGICGLFCKTCPSFADGKCNGCLSDFVAEHCAVCGHGFRDCAKEHGVVRCSECRELPCNRLRAFKDCHIVDGISHHEHIIDYVRGQRDLGVEAWAEEQEKLNTCPVCGTINVWCERKCRGCGREIAR